MTSDKPITAEETQRMNDECEQYLKRVGSVDRKDCIEHDFKEGFKLAIEYATQQTEALRKENERLIHLNVEHVLRRADMKAQADKLMQALGYLLSNFKSGTYKEAEQALNEYKTK